MAEGTVLEVVEGPLRGRRFPVTGSVNIGRDFTADVRLGDLQVSPRHACLSMTGHQAVIEDLGSGSGTFVNGEKIAKQRNVVLGDRIRVGLTVLELKAASREPEPPATTPDVASRAAPGTREASGAAYATGSGGPAGDVRHGRLEQVSIPPGAIGDTEAEQNYEALNRLADPLVKRQTAVAALALLAVAALALIVYFGIR